jgi:ATP-dependent Clp protease ATP-binding subunit ClpC
MFERYTEGARRVIFWSRYIASQCGCPEIEVEHLLVGLLREDMRLAERFLSSPWAVESVGKRLSISRDVGETPQGSVDLPLGSGAKCVLAFAAEEADQLSSRSITTGHLLLGILREEKCLPAKILNDEGVRLESTRRELERMPHDDSIRKQFVRENGFLPEDVVEQQVRVRLVAGKLTHAIDNHDFEKARSYSEEERKERDKLYLSCQQRGLLEWLFT